MLDLVEMMILRDRSDFSPLLWVIFCVVVFKSEAAGNPICKCDQTVVFSVCLTARSLKS